MKKLFFTTLLLLPLLIQAQGFRLDTIPVAPDDPRNISRRQVETVEQRQNAATTNLQPQQQAQPIANQESKENWRSELTPFPFDINPQNLRFGANIGLSRSRNFTTLALGPQVGYQFSDHFMAGMGIKYHHIRASTNSYTARSNLLGINLFGFYYPIPFIALFAQPELNRVWRSETNNTTNERVSVSGAVPVLLIGAGVRVGRSSHITINYDLVRHIHSPYPNTIFLGVSAFF